MDFLVAVLFIVIGIGLIVLCVMMAKKQSRNKKETEKQYDAHLSGLFKHMDGLPIPSGVLVNLYYGKRCLVIKKEQQEFTLNSDKIVDIDVVLGKDIKQQAAVGATVGKYVLGGLTGAALGAILTMSFYLVVTFKKDEENNFILLDTANSLAVANKIVKDFKNNVSKDTEKIEL